MGLTSAQRYNRRLEKIFEPVTQANRLVKLYQSSPDDSPEQDHAVRELEKLGFDKDGNQLTN